MSRPTVDSIATSYVPSLNALQLVEPKLLMLKVSTYESPKKSSVRNFKPQQLLYYPLESYQFFGTHEEELERILLPTIFSNNKFKISDLIQILLGVLFDLKCLSFFCGFLPW